MTRLRRLQPVSTACFSPSSAPTSSSRSGGLPCPPRRPRASKVLDSGLFSVSDQFLANLTRLLARENGVYPRWLLNSLLYAGVGAAIGTVLAAAVDYALSKYRFRGGARRSST